MSEKESGIRRRLLLKTLGMAPALMTVLGRFPAFASFKDQRQEGPMSDRQPMAKPMKVSWTPQARKVIHLSQEAAALLGTNYVAPEHWLLALLRLEDGVGYRVLQHLGVSPQRVRQELLHQVVAGEGCEGREIMLSPRGKQIIDFALEEAAQLQRDHVGTEHLLLGLIREGEGLPARVLPTLGASLDRTRQKIRELGLIEE